MISAAQSYTSVNVSRINRIPFDISAAVAVSADCQDVESASIRLILFDVKASVKCVCMSRIDTVIATLYIRAAIHFFGPELFSKTNIRLLP